MSQSVRSRLDQALVPARPASLGRGKRARLVLAGGLSLALAAGVAAVAVAGSDGLRHGRVTQAGAGATRWAPASRSVRDVAYRVAAIAAAQPDVRPGQWVYWKEQQLGGKPDGTFQVWTTADSRRAAYVDDKGMVRFIPVCYGDSTSSDSRSCAQYIGQPAVFVAPHDTSFGGVTGTIPVSYAGLRTLPRTPRALVAYLASLRFPHWAGWGPPPVRVFEIIEEMLTTYVMPPALTAELYRALALIPGIAIDRHASDVAGRPGIGLSMAIPPGFGGGINEIVIDLRTHQLGGQQLLTTPHAGAAGHVLSGTAILQHALVSGPGQLP
jgi:hypothetical protein